MNIFKTYKSKNINLLSAFCTEILNGEWIHTHPISHNGLVCAHKRPDGSWQWESTFTVQIQQFSTEYVFSTTNIKIQIHPGHYHSLTHSSCCHSISKHTLYIPFFVLSSKKVSADNCSQCFNQKTKKKHEKSGKTEMVKCKSCWETWERVIISIFL